MDSYNTTDEIFLVDNKRFYKEDKWTQEKPWDKMFKINYTLGV